jgi:hypothetical protein
MSWLDGQNTTGREVESRFSSQCSKRFRRGEEKVLACDQGGGRSRRHRGTATQGHGGASLHDTAPAAPVGALSQRQATTAPGQRDCSHSPGHRAMGEARGTRRGRARSREEISLGEMMEARAADRLPFMASATDTEVRRNHAATPPATRCRESEGND